MNRNLSRHSLNKIAGKQSGPDAELEDISLIASQITDWFIMISDNMSLSLESSTLKNYSGFMISFSQHGVENTELYGFKSRLQISGTSL